MKLLLINLLLSCGMVGYRGCGKKEGNLLTWSSKRKLTWADFRDTIKIAQHIILAVSAIIFRIKYKFKDRQLVDFDIVCVFIKDAAWTRDATSWVLSMNRDILIWEK